MPKKTKTFPKSDATNIPVFDMISELLDATVTVVDGNPKTYILSFSAVGFPEIKLSTTSKNQSVNYKLIVSEVEYDLSSSMFSPIQGGSGYGENTETPCLYVTTKDQHAAFVGVQRPLLGPAQYGYKTTSFGILLLRDHDQNPISSGIYGDISFGTDTNWFDKDGNVSIVSSGLIGSGYAVGTPCINNRDVISMCDFVIPTSTNGETISSVKTIILQPSSGLIPGEDYFIGGKRYCAISFLKPLTSRDSNIQAMGPYGKSFMIEY